LFFPRFRLTLSLNPLLAQALSRTKAENCNVREVLSWIVVISCFARSSPLSQLANTALHKFFEVKRYGYQATPKIEAQEEGS